MQDRFKFRAIVKGYYYIDTPEECEEFEPLIFLEDVDVLSNGEIGIMEDKLEVAIREQHPNLDSVNIGYMLEYFRENGCGIDNYVTITPEVIYQRTGLKDKNGKLIYEGDLLRYPPKDKDEETNFVVCEVFFHNNDCCDKHIGFQMNRFRFQGNLCGIINYGNKYNFVPENVGKMEVIGNIYENPELLSEVKDEE